jgi:putative RecB family exonuclease
VSDNQIVPPTHLSPSSAATFAQCPRRWKLRHLDRMPDPPGPPALVGTLTHRVLELLLNEPAGNRTLDRARELAKVAWPEVSARSEFTKLALDAEGVKNFKWRVWRAVEGLWHLEDPDGIEVAATEQRLETTLGGVPFVGIIDRVDRVDGQLVVTDYKSGRPPRPGHVAEKLDQVLLYAGAVAATVGEQPARARLLYLGAAEFSIEATPTAVDQAVGRLANTWDLIGSSCQADAFAPKPGVLCGWCPFVDQCPEGRAEVDDRYQAGWLPVDAPAVRRAA